MAEINAYVDDFGGMKIPTHLITNIHGKNNNKSFLCKSLIKIERKTLLFTFFNNL
jgi:hypothetical protein